MKSNRFILKKEVTHVLHKGKYYSIEDIKLGYKYLIINGDKVKYKDIEETERRDYENGKLVGHVINPINHNDFS